MSPVTFEGNESVTLERLHATWTVGNARAVAARENDARAANANILQDISGRIKGRLVRDEREREMDGVETGGMQ